MQKINTENLCRSRMWRHFTALKDPRVKDNQKYQFQHLMFFIVCAIICGANNVEDIVNYIDSKIEWLRKLFGIETAPSYKTIWWLLVLMDPGKLNGAFSNFIDEIRGSLLPEERSLEKELIAIDGKTSRGQLEKGSRLCIWSRRGPLLYSFF